MSKRDGEVALYAVALSFAIYVCSYFALVRPMPAFSISLGGTTGFNALPDYRGIPAELFQPIHYLDRRILRPKKWEWVESNLLWLDRLLYE